MGQVVEVEQQIQQVQAEDLKQYHEVGVIERFVVQGEDDEACEVAWLKTLGVEDGDVLFVVEAGVALEEKRDRESKSDSQ